MRNKLILALRLAAAAILVQTLFFKFTGAPESKFIFSTLGVEPWGRWLSGVVELFASLLLLVPTTAVVGAIIAIGVMVGAIVSHIFILGLVVQDDGGLLFALACTETLLCVSILGLKRSQLHDWFNRAHIMLAPRAR